MRTEWKKWLNKHHQLLMISVAIWLFAFGCKTIFFSEHQYFDQDAVRDYLFIKQHLEQKDFYIPLGPAAASYSNFSVLPGYYYLQLLAQSLGADYFYAMVWMIMILESCTPVLLYWYLQKLWPQGRKLSLLAIVSWCLAPMIMSASTASWNPNLIPLVTLFFLLSSHLWLFERRQIGLLGVILSFVAFANLHFQWFILLLAGLMCLLMALKRWRVSRKTILVGVIIALVTVSPYLHFEITHGWSNVRAALAFIGQSGTSERLRKPIFWLYFFPGFYGRAISGHLFLSDWQQLYEKTLEVVFSPVMIIMVVIFWGVMLGYVWQLWELWASGLKLRWRACLWPFAIWWSAVITLRLFYKGDKPDYFLYCLLPYIWVFGSGLAYRWSQIFPKAMVILTVALIGVEVTGLMKIARVNAFGDYQEFISELSSYPTDQRALVILNQNLRVPLEYFLPAWVIKTWPEASATYNIFLCDFDQYCHFYAPESTNAASNYYKYDLVTPVNYSIVYPHYQATMSAAGHNQSLGWYIVGQDK